MDKIYNTQKIVVKYAWIETALSDFSNMSIAWAFNVKWMDSKGIDVDKAHIIIKHFKMSTRFRSFLDHTAIERNPGVTASFAYIPFSYKQYLTNKENQKEYYENG